MKRLLCENLRTEIGKDPNMTLPDFSRNGHNKLLSEITDGTYPIMADDDDAADVVERRIGQEGCGRAGE